MKIILARHGETDWNLAKRIQGQHDIELNSTGRMQAEQLGKALHKENHNIIKIYSSKQKRAALTAEIANKELKVVCQAIEGLEEMNFGLWEGFTWAELEEKYPFELSEWCNNRRYSKIHKGESYQELVERVLTALQRIIASETGTILVVTHGAVMMALQSYLNNTPFEEMIKRYGLGNVSTVILDSEDIIEGAIRLKRFGV
jgi:probable phosphoglycerate mutase